MSSVNKYGLTKEQVEERRNEIVSRMREKALFGAGLGALGGLVYENEGVIPERGGVRLPVRWKGLPVRAGAPTALLALAGLSMGPAAGVLSQRIHNPVPAVRPQKPLTPEQEERISRNRNILLGGVGVGAVAGGVLGARHAGTFMHRDAVADALGSLENAARAFDANDFEAAIERTRNGVDALRPKFHAGPRAVVGGLIGAMVGAPVGAGAVAFGREAVRAFNEGHRKKASMSMYKIASDKDRKKGIDWDGVVDKWVDSARWMLPGGVVGAGVGGVVGHGMDKDMGSSIGGILEMAGKAGVKLENGVGQDELEAAGKAMRNSARKRLFGPITMQGMLIGLGSGMVAGDMSRKAYDWYQKRGRGD